MQVDYTGDSFVESLMAGWLSVEWWRGEISDPMEKVKISSQKLQ